jgi:mannosyltransferase
VRITRWGLPLLAAVCVVRLWLMQLPSSFWVDEMATIFVVEHGGDDPSLKAAPQVPQSIYYPVLRAVTRGRSEVAYRLPSILFIGVALMFVGLLVKRLIHPDAWWFAIFACFALRGINYEAANARPYALGICVAAAGLYFLVRWLDAGRLWDAALFMIFAALLWRVHLIFWPFYVVFAVYAIWQGMAPPHNAPRQVPQWQIAIAFGIIAISLIPVAMRAIELNAQAQQHVVVEQPTWMNLGHSFHLPLIAATALGAWIWSRLTKVRERVAIPSSALALILAWWLWHPVALFAFSRITGNSVFVPRYLALSLPGAAVAAALAAAWFLPSRFWKPAALIMGLGALIVSGNLTELWPSHHNSDWRAAAMAVNRLALPPSTPVICPSPFVEARSPVWTPDYEMPGFLYAPLLVYPVRGNVVLFPFMTSPEAEDYATALLQGALPAAGRFVIYGANGGAHFWRDWFERRPELAGWSHRSLGDFKDVDVVMFERK